MSHRSSGQHYRADSGRMLQADAPRPAAAHHHGAHLATHHAPSRHPKRKTDYTLGHSGRQFRIAPITFWIAVGSLVIMAGWSLATGTYFAFHDDVLTRLIARQKDQQFARSEEH